MPTARSEPELGRDVRGNSCSKVLLSQYNGSGRSDLQGCAGFFMLVALISQLVGLPLAALIVNDGATPSYGGEGL